MESTTPQTTPSDQFDKALEFANKLADREIASTNRQYDRFMKMVGGCIAFILVMVGFIGWRTWNDVRSIADEAVAREVKRQLVPDNVKKVVDDVIAKQAQTDLQNSLSKQVNDLVSKKVASSVAREVARQQPQILGSVNARVAVALNQLQPQIDKLVDTQTKLLVVGRVSKLRLSPDQKDLLVSHLLRMGPRFAILIRPSDTEAARLYANDLGEAFLKAGWESYDLHQSNHHSSGNGVFVGSLAAGAFSQKSSSDVSQLQDALNSAGLATQITDEKGSLPMRLANRPCLILNIWQTDDSPNAAQPK